METTQRIYIVSFGDSNQYRFTFDDKNDGYALHHSNPLANVEKEIRTYLESLFPNVGLAFYYTPKVVEVEPSHAARYQAYPPLDAKAIEEIKHVLAKEVRDRRSIEELNSNAPFADAPV